MSFSRRKFVSSLATLPLVTGLPRLAFAEKNIGSGRLTTVSDGHLILPRGFLFDPMPQAELKVVLQDFDLSQEQLMPECNLTLYQDGTNTVLFDVGSGPDFMPSAGKVTEALDALGLTPDQITHVVFTHAHPDHIWGLLDEFDDPVFPDATFMMGRAEWDYWWDPETVNTIGDARAAFAVGARRRLEAIEDSVELFDDAEEILPGIAATATYGHTPGHMGFELRQDAEAALIVGDAIGNHHVAFARPGWPSGADQDQDKAISTRRMLLDRLSGEGMTLVGFHLPGGGMGRVEKSDDGYRFIQGDT